MITACSSSSILISCGCPLCGGLMKTAEGVDVVLAPSASRFMSDTLGRVGAVTSLKPLLFERSLDNPYDDTSKKETSLLGNFDVEDLDSKDERAKLYKNVADAIQQQRPDALSDTKVYLGGVGSWDRLKRTWKNKRTTLLSKLLGTVSIPATSVMMNLTRGDHYDPVSDTVALYSDNPAVLTHELGHAIDMNSWRNPHKDKKHSGIIGRAYDAVRNEVKAIPHDTYMLTSSILSKLGLPIASSASTVGIEAAANLRSLAAIKDLEKKYPNLADTLKKMRTKTLPAAYTTYLGALGIPLAGVPKELAGLLHIGSALGVRGASNINTESFDDLYKQLEDETKEYDKTNKKKGKK